MAKSFGSGFEILCRPSWMFDVSLANQASIRCRIYREREVELTLSDMYATSFSRRMVSLVTVRGQASPLLILSCSGQSYLCSFNEPCKIYTRDRDNDQLRWALLLSLPLSVGLSRPLLFRLCSPKGKGKKKKGSILYLHYTMSVSMIVDWTGLSRVPDEDELHSILPR